MRNGDVSLPVEFHWYYIWNSLIVINDHSASSVRYEVHRNRSRQTQTSNVEPAEPYLTARTQGMAKMTRRT
jgi:hypothetical protein